MTASVISAPAPAGLAGELVVVVWTGQRATRLRVALRLTQHGYAHQLGVAVRTVAKWAAHPGLVPTPLVQSMLDTVLTRADALACARFALLDGAADRLMVDTRFDSGARNVTCQDTAATGPGGVGCGVAAEVAA